MILQRVINNTIFHRLKEKRRFIQVIAGPRQVGKTTSIQAVLKKLAAPSKYISADEPSLHDHIWLEQQWNEARLSLNQNKECVLVIDEIQKVPQWSEVVKRLWDEDTAAGRNLKVAALGSAPLLIQKGLSESLAGRFEIIRARHWSFQEMRDAFGWDVEQYVIFGGYPGAAPLVREPERWRQYVMDSLIETTISRDILALQRVDKPALLRQLFQLGCAYSGQIITYQKLVGQLQEAGNTTTLAHYLKLLENAGMLAGISKYAGQALRKRASSPKFQVLNTALLTAQTSKPAQEIRQDSQLWGRQVETAVGAHLFNSIIGTPLELYYWRERDREVDFVLKKDQDMVLVEVKSGRRKDALLGMDAFTKKFGPCRKLLVGGDGMAVEEFFLMQVEGFFR